MGAYANTDCSEVSWCFPLSHNEAACNPTKAIACCDSCGECCSFPLADDVRGLVGIHRSPIRDIGTGRKVCTDISHCDLGGKAKHTESYDRADAVEGDDEAAKLVVAANDGCDDDWDDGVEVRWGGKKNGLVLRKSHSRLEDYWQEVGQ